jgi:5-methylcytosine-specific restriction endonuclease McrA
MKEKTIEQRDRRRARERTSEYHQKRNIYQKRTHEQNINRTRDKALRLKKQSGGHCQICGYDKEIRILEFHHIKDKSFDVGKSYGRPIEILEKEVKNCILVCPNCHRIIHLNERLNKN